MSNFCAQARGISTVNAAIASQGLPDDSFNFVNPRRRMICGPHVRGTRRAWAHAGELRRRAEGDEGGQVADLPPRPAGLLVRSDRKLSRAALTMIAIIRDSVVEAAAKGYIDITARL